MDMFLVCYFQTDAIDFTLLRETLQRLKEGKKVEVPIYNFINHRRETKSVSMYGADVLIFEGILAFHMPDIVDMLDVKVIMDRQCVRLGDLLHFGQLFKASGNIYFARIAPISGNFC